MVKKELLESAKEILTDLLIQARSDSFGWCDINLSQLEIFSKLMGGFIMDRELMLIARLKRLMENAKDCETKLQCAEMIINLQDAKIVALLAIIDSLEK